MIQENEIVMLLIGAGLCLFIMGNMKDIRRFPYYRLFLLSFLLNFLGWFSTVTESFFLPDVLNIIEHLSYAAGGILFSLWSWKVIKTSGEKN